MFEAFGSTQPAQAFEPAQTPQASVSFVAQSGSVSSLFVTLPSTDVVSVQRLVASPKPKPSPSESTYQSW